MSPEKIIAICGAGIMVVTALVMIVRFSMKKMPMRLKKDKYKKQWVRLQGLLKEEKKWPEAIVSADQLLDTVLKKRGFKGRKMGERLVSAQREFKDNDSVWFGHKLAMKIEEDPEFQVSKQNVKTALLGIGQALKDLGAL